MARQSASAQIRLIKTGRTHYPAAPAQSNHFTGLRAVPWIRLRGVWLEQAGFSVGKILRVSVHRKLIVISTE